MPNTTAQQLRHAFAERLGFLPEQAEQNIRETLVLCNGLYCGRRFTLQDYSLVWFIEENAVKLSTSNGRVVMSCDAALFINQSSRRQAA
jgi:hypothetical protein